MELWQNILIFIYGLFGVYSAYVGHKKVRNGKEKLKAVVPIMFYGAFVWADIVVFGIFWFFFSVVCLLLNDWILFLLGQSLFWVVRSLGETIFWFNQQFSTIKRYSHEDIFISKYFGNHDYTVWFVMQIIMQCITVISLITSLYLGSLWLNSFGA